MVKKPDVSENILVTFIYVIAAILIAIVVVALQGCTVLQPDNEVRVAEYGGEGSYLAQAQGQIAGCRAVQNGEVNGCMRFKGSTCTFVSDGCK